MKKIVLLITIILSLFFVTGAWAAPGDTASNPIIITTAAQLDNIRVSMDKYFRLGNDIDLTEYLAPSGAGYAKWGVAGWLPIGTESTPFTGEFDGDRNKITGLWIDRSTDYVGLFGLTSNATIENLGVEISSLGVKGYGGGLIGRFYGGRITNCYATGNVSNGGGLVGSQTGGTITKCYATGNVSGGGGGLVGSQNGGSIINCYATGNVSGGGGGLVGSQNSNINSSSIENCYATGNVSGNMSAGGLVGSQQSTSNISINNGISIIMNCYATGNVDSNKHAGGLVGDQYNGSSITNCYATGSVSGNGNVGGLVGWQLIYNKLCTITNSFAIGNISGYDSQSTGGILGTFTFIWESTFSASSISLPLHIANNNFRYQDMAINGVVIPTYDPESAPNERHGGTVTKNQLMTRSTYNWIFGATGPWYWDDEGFPKLNMGSEKFPFTWGVPSMPVITITTQPEDITSSYVRPLSLSIKASVIPQGELFYQWYSGDTAILGATSASFAPNYLNVGTFCYHCVVSSPGAFSRVSRVATVTVIPAISSRPGLMETVQSGCNVVSYGHLAFVLFGAVLLAFRKKK
jgi:hypothetical protein